LTGQLPSTSAYCADWSRGVAAFDLADIFQTEAGELREFRPQPSMRLQDDEAEQGAWRPAIGIGYHAIHAIPGHGGADANG
jgi:hypothetical protein